MRPLHTLCTLWLPVAPRMRLCLTISVLAALIQESWCGLLPRPPCNVRLVSGYFGSHYVSATQPEAASFVLTTRRLRSCHTSRVQAPHQQQQQQEAAAVAVAADGPSPRATLVPAGEESGLQKAPSEACHSRHLRNWALPGGRSMSRH